MKKLYGVEYNFTRGDKYEYRWFTTGEVADKFLDFIESLGGHAGLVAYPLYESVEDFINNGKVTAEELFDEEN